MNPRILQYLQNALLTTVTIVLFLVVLSAFLRVIRPPETVAVPAGVSGDVTASTLAAEGDNVVGDVTETTVVAEETPVSLAPGEEPECREPAPPAGSGTVLRVYYPCGLGGSPDPDTFVYRSVPDTDLVLTRTLEQMVLGPDADEQSLGFGSVFSEATTRSFASVRIEGGRAVIDFIELENIENLADSADNLLATLGANVFQFDTISSAEYRLGGSCDAFYALLQQECIIVTRQSWNQQVARWRTGA